MKFFRDARAQFHYWVANLFLRLHRYEAAAKAYVRVTAFRTVLGASPAAEGSQLWIRLHIASKTGARGPPKPVDLADTLCVISPRCHPQLLRSVVQQAVCRSPKIQTAIAQAYHVLYQSCDRTKCSKPARLETLVWFGP
jgi:hypothetical protein